MIGELFLDLECPCGGAEADDDAPASLQVRLEGSFDDNMDLEDFSMELFKNGDLHDYDNNDRIIALVMYTYGVTEDEAWEFLESELIENYEEMDDF